MRVRILALAKQFAFEAGTEKNWFSHYSKAVSTVVNNLDDEEKLRMQDAMTRWEEKGIPEEVQAK